METVTRPWSGWRAATVTMVAVLGAWLSSWALADATGQQSDLIILGVVVALTSARANARTRATYVGWFVRLAVIAGVAIVASEVGHLFQTHRWSAALVFSLVLGAAIWVRRFGSRAATLGSFVSLPFITVLVAPVVPQPGHSVSLWPALVGAIAFLWVTVSQALADALGFAPLPPSRAPTGPTPAPEVGLRPTTRLALQMTLSVMAGCAVGFGLLGEHWMWAALSAYVVAAGNRGRGDVALKGANRLVGAVLGTIAATALAGAFGPGERSGLVVLFAVMALALVFRERYYAAWAAGVTAMLALLHGYYGQYGLGPMVERVGGVVLGSALAVAVAWFLLPIRTRDVWHKRYGEARRAAASWRDALREAPEDVPSAQARFEAALAELALIEPTWQAHRRWWSRLGVGWTADPSDHPVEQLAALRQTHRRLLSATARRSALSAREEEAGTEWD